jgi:hypothetical protein
MLSPDASGAALAPLATTVVVALMWVLAVLLGKLINRPPARFRRGFDVIVGDSGQRRR